MKKIIVTAFIVTVTAAISYKAGVETQKYNSIPIDNFAEWTVGNDGYVWLSFIDSQYINDNPECRSLDSILTEIPRIK